MATPPKQSKKRLAEQAARHRDGQRQVAKADARASEERINKLAQAQLKKLMKGAEREEALKRAEAEFTTISKQSMGANRKPRGKR